MNGRAAQALEIRIGALVEHESERSVLREIERLLADDGRPAIVFANFEIGVAADRPAGCLGWPRSGHRGEGIHAPGVWRRERALAGPSVLGPLEGFPEPLSAGTRCGPRGKERRRRFRQDRPSLHRCGGRVRARNSVGVAGLPGQPQGFRHWTGRVGDGAWQADARRVVGRSVEGVCRSSRTDSGIVCVCGLRPRVGGGGRSSSAIRGHVLPDIRRWGDPGSVFM